LDSVVPDTEKLNVWAKATSVSIAVKAHSKRTARAVFAEPLRGCKRVLTPQFIMVVSKARADESCLCA